jgi:hypothetical protein
VFFVIGRLLEDTAQEDGRRKSQAGTGQGPGAERRREADREQLNTREAVVRKFGLDESRYDDFSYLCYLDIENVYVQNYVEFQLGKADPVIKGRISANEKLWKELGTPEWLLELLTSGGKNLIF